MNSDSRQPEQRLIERTLSGDSAAFGALLEPYQDRLFAATTYLVGNEEDARDVVQEACLKAFVKLRSFRGTSAFYTWLYRIAMNTALSWKRKRRETVSVDAIRDGSGSEPESADPAPGDSVEIRERQETVRRAISQLDEDARTIVVLREIDGMDYRTIAETLDIEIGTVRSRLFRARMKLRELLRDQLEIEAP